MIPTAETCPGQPLERLSRKPNRRGLNALTQSKHAAPFTSHPVRIHRGLRRSATHAVSLRQNPERTASAPTRKSPPHWLTPPTNGKPDTLRAASRSVATGNFATIRRTPELVRRSDPRLYTLILPLRGQSGVAQADAALLELLTALFAHHLDADDSSAPNSARHALVLRIQAFIRQYLRDPQLTPPAIAAAHHISVSYLHRGLPLAGPSPEPPTSAVRSATPMAYHQGTTGTTPQPSSPCLPLPDTPRQNTTPGGAATFTNPARCARVRREA